MSGKNTHQEIIEIHYDIFFNFHRRLVAFKTTNMHKGKSTQNARNVRPPIKSKNDMKNGFVAKTTTGKEESTIESKTKTKQHTNNVKLSQEQMDTYRKYKQRKTDHPQTNEIEKEESTRYSASRKRTKKGN